MKNGGPGIKKKSVFQNLQPLLQGFEVKVSKGAKIRNRYNQVPHLTQDTNGKVPNSQLDTKNESQEVSPFPAGDHKAHINRRAQRHSTHKTEKTECGSLTFIVLLVYYIRLWQFNEQYSVFCQ